MSELEVREHAELLDVLSGELLPATVENAGRVIQAARSMKQRINDVVADATAWLAEESARQGTRTLHTPGVTLTLSGGTTEEYDPLELQNALWDAGCPNERVDEAVVATVTYKVNRSVLRQLAGANPDYRAAIESAKRMVEKPMRATIKGA